MSPGGLTQHIYDVGETSGLIQQNATLDPTNHVGVHSNASDILFGSYDTSTKQWVNPGGLTQHIYDVGETPRLIHAKRNVGPPSCAWGPF